MKFYIVTLEVNPCIANALSQAGAPVLFLSKKTADKEGIKNMVAQSKQHLYKSIPIFVHTDFEKHVVKVTAPGAVHLDVTTNHEKE